MALALPGTVERDHHGFPSFRIGNAIFATLPEAATLRVMLDHDAAEEAVATFGGCCAILHWGKKVSGVAIALPAADPDVVAELLDRAWRRRGGQTG